MLIPELLKATDLPVISAGGVGDYKGMQEIMALGACGVSIGSPFIACDEAEIDKSWVEAISCVRRPPKWGKESGGALRRL